MGLLLRKLSLSCCFFFSILKIRHFFFFEAVLVSVSRRVGELFPVSHKCKQHFVEKTLKGKLRWVPISFPGKIIKKDSGGFYDCVNFFW